MTIRRLLIVPRWGATPKDDFYPWLRAQLGQSLEVIQPEFLRPQAPRIREWEGPILAQLWLESAQTLLLGHAVGCQAILRALARLEPGRAVGGMIGVAGWWTVDAPWDTLHPWLNIDYDLPRARAAIPRCHILLSDNDPFTADHVANAALWQERLGATCSLHPGAGHFNAPEQPAVLQAVQAMCAPS